MKPIARLFLGALILPLTVSTRADTLTLKNGTMLNGKYLNSTGEAMRFQTVTGEVQTIAYSEVLSLSTDPGSTAVVNPVSYVTAPTATDITVPTGTVLLVQMMDSVSSKSAPGAIFTTKLQYDLVANGVVAVRAGTIVYGKVQSVTQAGRAFGKSTLDIRLTQMVANGIPVPLMTGSFTPHIAAEEKKAVTGESTASLNSGQTLTIPSGALLEFTLQQPVNVTMVR